MGGVCTGGTAKNRVGIRDDSGSSSSGSSKMVKSINSIQQPKNEDPSSSCPDRDKTPSNLYDSGELCFSISREIKPSTPTRTGAHKASSSFLGKASSLGIEKAVLVLDTLGSSMTNLNSGSFMTGTASRGSKIFILAFEIANTITKAANLLQTLSVENVRHLKKEILPSKAVQQLVSTDMKELLAIAAEDKREDFAIFSREVIRFGNMCKDPQWHNLDRYFSKLDTDTVTHKQLGAEAEMTMRELITMAQQTSDLYHELHALNKFEQDYQRKIDHVKFFKPPLQGEDISMFESELKHQRKIVNIMKKKSLWFKGMEEVVEKLVDIVPFLHQKISEAFGDDGVISFRKEPTRKPERLGEIGLALHYASLITQIDNIALRPTSIALTMRDTLYNGLPPDVKKALRSRLQSGTKEEITVPQIKAEIQKTLQWLLPVATATARAHEGFGWIGEWANTGMEFGKKVPRLKTLYYADRQKMDQLILELVTLLQRQFILMKNDGPKTLSPTRKGLVMNTEMMSHDPKTAKVQLSLEERDLLAEVVNRRMLVPRISKSQELVVSKNGTKQILGRSRSTGSCRQTELNHSKANVLDVLDGIDSANKMSI